MTTDQSDCYSNEGKSKFYVGAQFESDSEFVDAIEDFSSKWGFHVSTLRSKRFRDNGEDLFYADNGWRFKSLTKVCSRYGAQRIREKTTPTEKQRVHNWSMKQGCSFIVHAAAFQRKFVIKKCCIDHLHGCLPSPRQLVVDKWRSGFYTKFNDRAWLQIISTVEAHAPARTLRAVVKKFLPSRVPVTAQQLCNISARAKVESSRISAQENISGAESSRSRGADATYSDIFGKAEEEARLQLQDTLETSSGWNLLHYLRRLKSEMMPSTSR